MEKVEINDEIREELTKNQISRLFTIKVVKHFNSSVEMDAKDFWKYMKEANDEFKAYYDKEKKKENETKRNRRDMR